jgi:glycosyltransferase involved in cell wall biosynthesis
MKDSALPSLRIGILTGTLSPHSGGLFHSVRMPARRMAALGHQVDAFGLLLPGESMSAITAWWPGVTVHPQELCGPQRFGYAPGLARALARCAPDLIHLHGLWMFNSVCASRWRRNTNKPLVISPRGMLDSWALANAAWKKRVALALFERANIQGASVLHALNSAEHDAIRDFGWQGPVAVIGNAVTLPEPANNPPVAVTSARKKLLFLGRIHPKKGLDNLLEAWAILIQQSPTLRAAWQLVIAGWDDGGHLAGLRARASHLGLDAEVEFTGPVHGAEKAALLQASHGFILPSHSEGMPMAVLEAWSHSLPVFMTAACNLPIGFAQGAAVEISQSPQALADTLQSHLAQERLADMGTQGRALVSERFSLEQSTDQLLAVYRWICGQGEQPDCVEPAVRSVREAQ